MVVDSDEVTVAVMMTVVTGATACLDSADHAMNWKLNLILLPPMIVGVEAVDEEEGEVDEMPPSVLATMKDMVMATVMMTAMAMEAEGVTTTTTMVMVTMLSHFEAEEEEEDAVEAEDGAAVAVVLKTEVKRLLLKPLSAEEPKCKPTKAGEMTPEVALVTLLQWFKQPLVAEVDMDSVVAALCVEAEDEAEEAVVRKLLA